MFLLLEIGGQGPSMNDVFEYFEHQRTSVGLQDSGFVMIVTMTGMGMTVIMMATTAAEEGNACDVYYQSEHSNCDGFIEVNRNRPHEARKSHVADEERVHGEDDTG